MQIRTIITVIVLLSWTLGFSQSSHIGLDIENKKMSYFRAVENSLGSKIFDSDQTYISSKNLAQPEIFVRTETILPDLLVYYTYFNNDSTISEILYEWDVYNFNKKDSNIQSIDFERNLIEKYKQIIEFVSLKYGSSEMKGDSFDLISIELNKGFKRTDIWKPTDSLKIYSYVVISNYFRKTKFTTVNPTHRIRVYIYNLRKSDRDTGSN